MVSHSIASGRLINRYVGYVFDNPATMARELWQDGKMVFHIQANVFALRPGNQPKIPPSMNWGPFKCGWTIPITERWFVADSSLVAQAGNEKS